MRKIFFDMDGTVYDLYHVENWLQRLRDEDDGVFLEGAPLVNLDKLKEKCLALIEKGFQIGIITWLPIGASLEFMEDCTLIKRQWTEENMPYVSEFYTQEYGTPKQYAPSKRAARMILIDDNKEVREMWNTEKQRISYDPNDGILETLDKILKTDRI